jgi:hypothetical protein
LLLVALAAGCLALLVCRGCLEVVSRLLVDEVDCAPVSWPSDAVEVSVVTDVWTRLVFVLVVRLVTLVTTLCVIGKGSALAVFVVSRLV